MPATDTLQPTKRIQSIDILRGIIMIVMALDHARDFLSGYKYEPTDIAHASALLFFTRWATHFCAPVFIFLSGTSVFLSMGRKASKRHAAWRLLTRGLWLIVLEVTVVRFGWMFDVNYQLIILQVIWAIGWCMVCLSGLIFLPRGVVLAFGLLLIFGHNLLDGVQPTGSMGVLWQFLHVQSPLKLADGRVIFIVYPLIPWIGVMAVGYCFGAIFRKEGKERDRYLYTIGLAAITLFLLLRSSNLYGDPLPWQHYPEWWRTLDSFLNCTKYPPSLLYLLMTLGPAITALPLLEKMNGPFARFFTVYGWVPFFYYILHIYILHGLSLFATDVLHPKMIVNVFTHPAYPIYVVYACWLSCVLLLYYPCRWFMGVKKKYKVWWLSYL